MPKLIKEFRGEYFFLSNFFHHELTYDGEKWISAESAYQAGKTLKEHEQAMIRNAISARAAKKLGRRIELRPDWDLVKIGVMERVLRAKFKDKELRRKLIATGDAILIEGNVWGDDFWGMCEGSGHNMLGVLLMKERTQCRLEFEHASRSISA